MARPPVPIFGISKPDVPKFSSRDDDDEVFGRTHYTRNLSCYCLYSFHPNPPHLPPRCSPLLCPEHLIRARSAHEPLVSHSRVAGELVQDKHQSLKVVGYSSSLYQDDETMAWLESQKHLQLWMENKEEDLWIDRYDVRQLLSDASLFAK